jgi:hypothetical protein
MYSLEYPAAKVGDPLALLSTALGGTSIPAGMKWGLRRMYRRYVSARGAACAIPSNQPLKAAYGASLRAAYKQTYEGKPLEWLRTTLQAIAGNRCPSCGGTRPVELDHHLAQTPFPEYAIFPLNLVAMCGPCNKRKSASGGSNIAKAFLHPYLDAIPRVPFFAANVTRTNGTYDVTFTFLPIAISDPLLAERMKHQLERIKINKALCAEVGELLVELAYRIDTEIVDPNGGVIDPTVIATYLEKNADRIERQHRVGFWQAIMSRALATDLVFCSGGYRDLVRHT